MDIKNGLQFDHLIKTAKIVDAGRQLNDRIEKALFKMIKRSTSNEKVLGEM